MIKSKLLLIPGAMIMAAGMLTAVPTVANATSWKTVDTDNISRSVSSGRAYTTSAYFTWQGEHGVHAWEDWRGVWKANLTVRGAKGSCARLRVITYQYSKDSNGHRTYSISKRFPKAGSTRFGYYQICSASGRGTRHLSGSDIISNGPGRTHHYLQTAKISVCYAPRSSAPATSCYNFTIHKGD